MYECTERLSGARHYDLRIYPDAALWSILLTQRSYCFDNGDTFGNSVELYLRVETTQPTVLDVATDKKFFSISET